VEEGEQLEQVEAAKLRIAKPLPDQRRVEDDVRGLGRAGDRLAPARLVRIAAAHPQPDAGVGCVKCGKRQRSGHPRHLGGTRTEEQRRWTQKPSGLPRCSRRPWPYEEARKLLKRWPDGKPDGEAMLFETGYGPSGLPHIGTFNEVLRTTSFAAPMRS
jgi:hypothetical protein